MAVTMALTNLQAGRATTFDYATTAGYSALATGNSATVSLQGSAVTINSVNQGAGVTLGTVKQFTFAGEPPVTNLSNPAWVAGTHNFFDVTYNRTTAPDSTVDLDIQFSQPLPASSYLVFVDFDAREVLNIKAYDTGPTPSLIPFNAFTISHQNGNTPDGSLLAYPTWNSLTNYTGSLETGIFATTPEAVVSLLTSVPISRLQYEFTMNPTGSITSNDVQFNFAAVPEPASLGLAAATCLLICRGRRPVAGI
jgi:hypothetical protein